MSFLEAYELVDFGQGRKLERLGCLCLDRPCPAAGEARGQPRDVWNTADWQFAKSGERGRWIAKQPRNVAPTAPIPNQDDIDPTQWVVQASKFSLILRRTPFGQVGVFPEQDSNWQMIHQAVLRRVEQGGLARVLNLFGYTGGSTLAAAAAGGHVVHVDSARTNVQWARQNAQVSGLADAPIRWIVEDARRFVTREIRRGNRYDAIVLDPPSYGHGPKGEPWKLATGLMRLLDECSQLLSDVPMFVLLSCHSPGFGRPELGASLQQAIFGHCRGRVDTKRLYLQSSSGTKLNAGVAAIALFR